MSITGDFGKLAAFRDKVARALRMGAAVAQRAAGPLSSNFIAFSPSGSAIAGTLTGGSKGRISVSKFLPTGGEPFPGKWREDIKDAAREEFDAITGGG